MLTDNDKVLKALWATAFELTESMQRKLTNEGGKDTGNLQSSITPEVKQLGNGKYQITFSMSEHGKYVEFGTSPHMPPVEALEDWAERKLGDRKKAWALAMAIKKRGTRAYPFIRPTLRNELTETLNSNLNSAFKQ